MEPDTLAVIAVIGLLAVAALILAVLLNARRSAALRDQIDNPGRRTTRESDRRERDRRTPR